MSPATPLTSSAEDAAAAKRFDAFNNVDFPTQRRYMKDSAKWFSKIASTNTV